MLGNSKLMPDDIKRTLELAHPEATQPTGEPTVSRSARFSRVCGFLALGSVVLFWPVLIATAGGYKSHGGDPNAILFIIAGEGLLLLVLAVLAIISAVAGFLSTEHRPGSGKTAGLAIVLALLAVAGFLVPFIVCLSHASINYW
jgi:hypothetical protein